MNELPIPLPNLSIMRNEYMVTTCDQIIANVSYGTVVVNRSFLIEELLDETGVSQNDGSSGTEFKGENAAVLLCPF